MLGRGIFSSKTVFRGETHRWVIGLLERAVACARGCGIGKVVHIDHRYPVWFGMGQKSLLHTCFR